MVRRKLLSTDATSRECIFGPNMQENLAKFTFDNLTGYLVVINFLFAFASLGNNMQGNRLLMVFLIVWLIIVQNFASIIL